MAIEVEVREWSPGPPERVWELVGRVANWPSWSIVTKASLEREGTPDPDGAGAIRRLSTGALGSREEVVAWEPPRLLRYRLLSGLPLVDYESTVTLTPECDGTAIHWRSTFRARYRGTGPVMRAFIKLTLSRFAKALASKAADPAA